MLQIAIKYLESFIHHQNARTTKTVKKPKIKQQVIKLNQNSINQLIILLQNTRSVEEMESLPKRNASYFCTFLFNNNKIHDIKKEQKNIKE